MKADFFRKPESMILAWIKINGGKTGISLSERQDIKQATGALNESQRFAPDNDDSSFVSRARLLPG